MRRSADRFRTVADGVESLHCFSFGAHYDPTNVGFAGLVALNEERLAPGAGFDRHEHANVSLITYVVEGELEHDASVGGPARLQAGAVQVLDCGAGVWHAEHGPADAAARFLQFWVATESVGEPTLSRALPGAADDWVVLAAGDGAALVPLARPGSELALARPAPGDRLALPAAVRRLLFVVAGAVRLDDGVALQAGDHVRLAGADSRAVTAVGAGVELLLWTAAAAD